MITFGQTYHQTLLQYFKMKHVCHCRLLFKLLEMQLTSPGWAAGYSTTYSLVLLKII